MVKYARFYKILLVYIRAFELSTMVFCIYTRVLVTEALDDALAAGEHAPAFLPQLRLPAGDGHGDHVRRRQQPAGLRRLQDTRGSALVSLTDCYTRVSTMDFLYIRAFL